MYKRIVGGYKNGALSGKGIPYGGSLGRNEATGYGAVYFTEELFESIGKKLAGTTFALSGFGNVSWGVAKKLNELGAKVLCAGGCFHGKGCPEGNLCGGGRIQQGRRTPQECRIWRGKVRERSRVEGLVQEERLEEGIQEKGLGQEA